MKTRSIIFICCSLLLLAACTKENSNTEIIQVDVSADYPEKELILQDLFEIEYVPLETTDEFVTHGMVEAVGNEVILVKNRGRNNDFFLFDRKTGKGLKHINRFGQGAEEYSQATSLLLDEQHKEIYVKDYPGRKLFVYDYDGKFKRQLHFADSSYYKELYDYDAEHLLAFKGYLPTVESEAAAYILISKHTGEVTETLSLPRGEAIQTPVFIEGEIVAAPMFYLTGRYGDDWLLTRTSSDTIYRKGKGINPIIVRTPSIQTMNVQKYLFPHLFTEEYYFMSILEKGFNMKTMKSGPSTDIVYSTQDKQIYTYTLYNRDMADERPISLNVTMNVVLGSDIVVHKNLAADNLVDLLAKDKLSGRLKEIASTLKEDDNPVVMLIKEK